MIGLNTCLLLVCEYSLLTVSPWKTWSTISSSSYTWYYQVQSCVAKNRIHTYFVFQVLAQSICMNYNSYIKCGKTAPSSKSKNFLLVQTVCMGRYFILRDRRSVWAWQFLLFATWLTAGRNNDTDTEYRLREWWGWYICFCGCCLILQPFFHSDSVSDHIILFSKDLRLLLSMGFWWCQECNMSFN